VTSRTGAAIRDILNVVTRRFPNLHLVLAPAKVQGEGAAKEIADAIDDLNRLGGLDALIVGRGGGSVEDLWCFNEEIVARAIVRSEIPVISAVGHEIDYTISDFVADLRAPTPSAAAELVVGQKENFEAFLKDQRRLMEKSLRDYMSGLRRRFQAAAGSYVFREPRNLVNQYRQRIDGLEMRIRHDAGRNLQRNQQRLDAIRIRMERRLREGLRDGRRTLEQSGSRMEHRLRMDMQGRRQRLERLQVQLRSLNPLAVLQRGYSVTRDGEGRILRSVKDVKPGATVRTQLADGEFDAEVTERDKKRF
jgi:exodeoxyribonuclease VII large subunit